MFDVPILVPTHTLDDLQLRAGMHPRRHEAVRRAHAAGAVLDPVEVTIDASGVRRLDDGNHRLAVARMDRWLNVRVVFRRGGSAKEWAFYAEARNRGILPDRFITNAEYLAANAALVELSRERGGVR